MVVKKQDVDGAPKNPCPQCGAENYSPENDKAEHAYTCSMAR